MLSGKINILSESNYSALGIVREKSVTVDFLVLKIFQFCLLNEGKH